MSLFFYFFITHTLEGFTFKRICLNFPLKIQFANTPAIEFSICTVTGALLCMQNSPSSQVCPWQPGHTAEFRWLIPATLKGVEKLRPLFSSSGWKSTWSEYWIRDQPSNNLSIGTEPWISRLNLDLNFIGRNLSRKCRYFPDP